MNTLNKILILGSGQAAIYAASEIRKYDKDSEISIFGNQFLRLETFLSFKPQGIMDPKPLNSQSTLRARPC